MKALIALLLFACPLTLDSAQTPKKVWVIINAAGDDRVGISTLYHFKEAIARSSRYALEPALEESKLTSPVIVVQFTSVSLDESQISSAISVVAQKPHPESKCLMIFFHGVRGVGAKRAEETAKDLLADIDANYSK